MAAKPAYKLLVNTSFIRLDPIWNGGYRNEVNLLADCYWNSLQLAVEKGIRRIAFPSISTGDYGYPKNQAAEIAVKTVNEFVEANQGVLELVEWALLDEETVRVYMEALYKVRNG